MIEMRGRVMVVVNDNVGDKRKQISFFRRRNIDIIE
jgi:hypothetical protein